MEKKYSTAHQPAFMPWMGLLQKIYHSNNFILMDMANFRKRSFMHRNLIEINNLETYVGLSIPKRFDNHPCNKIEYDANNINKDLDTIYKKIFYEYKKEKFFKEIEFFFNDILNKKPKSFIELIETQNKIIFNNLKCKINFFKETEIFKENNYKKLNASEKLLQHAIYLQEKNYLTGINSSEYLDKKIFFKKKINYYIQNYDYDNLYKYQKVKKPLSFLHQLSKIGFDGINEYLNNIKFMNFKIVT